MFPFPDLPALTLCSHASRAAKALMGETSAGQQRSARRAELSEPIQEAFGTVWGFTALPPSPSCRRTGRSLEPCSYSSTRGIAGTCGSSGTCAPLGTRQTVTTGSNRTPHGLLESRNGDLGDDGNPCPWELSPPYQVVR